MSDLVSIIGVVLGIVGCIICGYYGIKGTGKRVYIKDNMVIDERYVREYREILSSLRRCDRGYSRLELETRRVELENILGY